MFQAFFTRKSSFLAQKDWKIIPFRHRPPSDMQSLLSDVASLPSILEATDILRDNSSSIASTKALKLKTDVLCILNSLSRWKYRFETEATELPNFTHDKQSSGHPDEIEHVLWFPSLLIANINIHVWAFELVCLLEMERLQSFLREHGYHTELEKNTSSENYIQTRTLELAIRICRSLKYLMQDEMRLHGPASAIFPLQIAYETLSKNQYANAAHLQHCWGLFKRIRHKGYQARLPLWQT